MLFIFGRKRVLPVNITSLNITETEFSTDLNPIRATVAVSLTVIEGKSVPYRYSQGDDRGDVGAATWPTSPTSPTSSSRGERHVQHGARATARCPMWRCRTPRAGCCPRKALRPLPEVTGTFRHTVDAGDRLDQLALHLLRRPAGLVAHLRRQPRRSCRRWRCSAQDPSAPPVSRCPDADGDPPWAALLAAADRHGRRRAGRRSSTT